MRALCALAISMAIGCASTPPCDPGRFSMCTCPGGERSAARCGDDGHLEACRCTDAGVPIDARRSVTPADAPPIDVPGADVPVVPVDAFRSPPRICAPGCVDDAQCASTCPANPLGANCCDVSSGTCYAAMTPICAGTCGSPCTRHADCACPESNCCDTTWGACVETTGGVCLACPPGTRPCDLRCVDPSTDAEHCGRCGNACPTGTWCTGGSCGVGAEAWERVLRGAELAAIAVDDAGTVFVTGTFSIDADLGGATLPNDGCRQIFVASYTRAGAHRWSRVLAGDTCGRSAAVAVTGSALYVGGAVDGPATFDAVTPPDVGPAFLARLDAADGTVVWARRFASSGDTDVDALAVAPDGTLVIAGTSPPGLDLGGGPLLGASTMAFVASLTSAGDHRWSRGLAVAFPASPFELGGPIAVAPDPRGGVVLASTFDGTVDVGGGPIASAGGLDVLVASFASEGAHRWSRGCAGAADASALAIATDPSGDRVHVLARFQGGLDCGVGVLSAAGTDLAVATFDAAGAPVRALRFGGPAWDQGGGLAVDRSGRIVFGGEFESELAIAGRMFTASDTASYLAAIDATLAPAWARVLPWPTPPTVDPVAIVAGPATTGVAGFVRASGGFGLGPSYLVVFRLDGT